MKTFYRDTSSGTTRYNNVKLQAWETPISPFPRVFTLHVLQEPEQYSFSESLFVWVLICIDHYCRKAQWASVIRRPQHGLSVAFGRWGIFWKWGSCLQQFRVWQWTWWWRREWWNSRTAPQSVACKGANIDVHKRETEFLGPLAQGMSPTWLSVW